MTRLKFNILFFLLILSSKLTFGQNDSLFSLLETETIDSSIVNIYLEISENQNEKDSALLFAEKALEISEISEDSALISKSCLTIGEIYNKLGYQEKAITYFSVAESFYINTKNKAKLIRIYNDKGYAYKLSGNNMLAGEYYLKAYKIVEEIGSDVDNARSLDRIASIYFAQKNYQGALDYWKKALKVVEKINYKKGISVILTSIGNVYLDKKNYDATLSFYKRALKTAEEISDSTDIGIVTNNLGNLYMDKKEFSRALVYYNKALSIKKAMQDNYGATSTLNNIARTYEKQNKLDSALATINIALDIAIENEYKSLQVQMYNEKAFILEANKKFEDALDVYNKYDSLRKKIYDKDIADAYSQNEKRYNYDKREKENQIYRTNQKAKEEKQRNFVIALIIGIIFLVVIAIIILRGYRQKKQANELLEEQRDEIEAQRNKVFEQKDELENIHMEITNSIIYAKRIQTSTLPKLELLKDVVDESFILFKPKDVVSGDFYWFATVEGQTVITVSDCTGHGVPGAFMSMLGMSLLKEIVVKEYMTEPSIILRKLRKEVINSLQQKGVSGEQKDGMDMALISYNPKTKLLKYSGANNPLYIVSKNEVSCDTAEIKVVESDNCNKKLYEIKANKMPIAIYVKMDKFISHEITLNEGDIVYMSSDGFPDQFGGVKGKKFKYKPFKKLILDNSNKPLAEQHELLNKTIVDWMGIDNEQIDDICIMGLKI